MLRTAVLEKTCKQLLLCLKIQSTLPFHKNSFCSTPCVSEAAEMAAAKNKTSWLSNRQSLSENESLISHLLNISLIFVQGLSSLGRKISMKSRKSYISRDSFDN